MNEDHEDHEHIWIQRKSRGGFLWQKEVVTMTCSCGAWQQYREVLWL